jgi:hypothetical protein
MMIDMIKDDCVFLFSEGTLSHGDWSIGGLLRCHSGSGEWRSLHWEN